MWMVCAHGVYKGGTKDRKKQGRSSKGRSTKKCFCVTASIRHRVVSEHQAPSTKHQAVSKPAIEAGAFSTVF